MKSREKELSIETLRGFAIIFMVAGHVIGIDGSGMNLAKDSGWSYFYFSFEYLRMPLFTVISGYVYSLWPIGNSGIFNFLKGKARRILLPMISVGTLHFFAQYFIPGTNAKFPLSDIWKIYIIAYEHFWFLQAIFLIFVLIAIIDSIKMMITFKNWLLVFLLAALIRNFIPAFSINIFSINGFFNLLPFFLLGCGIQRFNNAFSGKVIIKSGLLVFIVSVILQQYVWFSGFSINDFEYRILSLCVACSGIIIFFYIRKNIAFISKIGYYAYGIYLFHVFGTASSRIFLMKFGLNQHVIIFTAGLICGLGFPIIIELVLEKSKILRRLFLGLR
jgi:glucans biosynthesis protein C